MLDSKKLVKNMTVREILRSASLRLQQAGCGTPRLDAELLLAKAMGQNRIWLITHADDDMPPAIQSEFASLLQRRCQREPVAYIVGEKEFWSRPFHVTPDVLIPRPETEHLIEAALQCFPDKEQPYHFCDIGTGSGCIAITLAHEFPHAHITATDIDAAALSIACENAVQHGVGARIEFSQGDMFAALHDDACFHLIVSNPPYVTMDEMSTLAPELAFEPVHALTDKKDGLSFLHALYHKATHHLYPDAYLIVETGQCGLPIDTSPTLSLKQFIDDLAGQLRGGIYQHHCSQTDISVIYSNS